MKILKESRPHKPKNTDLKSDSALHIKRDRKISSSRSRTITIAGVWFIATNFLLAILNVIVGTLAGSIAIVSDATHSLIDAVSGFLIIISERLAIRHDTHREQIERITTILVALIIIIVGIHIIIESIEKFISPEEPDYTAATIIVLILSIIMKLVLAIYLKRRGKSERSTVLIASSAETLNDTWISIAVLASAIIYLIWHIDIEAYISLVIAIIIIKIGLEFIFPHISHHHHHALESNPDHDHCQTHH